MHTSNTSENKKVELTSHTPTKTSAITYLKTTNYKYSKLEKSAIIHFNNDTRYTITE